MRTRLNSLFIAFLNVAASTQKLGYQPDPCSYISDIRLDRWSEILEL